VRLLLEISQVTVDSRDLYFGWTPLSLAARYRHEAVVKLIIETVQIDVDSEDTLAHPILSRTAKLRYEEVVKLLPETRQVDMVPKDYERWTPFFLAALEREGIVKLLLEKDWVEVGSDNTLSYAATFGRTAVVKLLLQTGQIGVDPKNPKGLIPLSLAAKHGYEAVMKILLGTWRRPP
jgi:ankyrin repeat protein